MPALARQGVSAAMARSSEVPVYCLGHLSPPAVLHPDSKRSPGGCVMDLSLAKNCVAPRHTHINDFLRELPRPPMYGDANCYYDVSNEEVAATVLYHELNSNADEVSLRMGARNAFPVAMAQT